MMGDIEEIISDFREEVGGILGVIAFMVDWPTHKSLPGLEIRIGRLRRLVEDLHGIIK